MRPRPTNLVFNILAQNEKIWVLPRSYYFSPYIEVASYTLLPIHTIYMSRAVSSNCLKEVSPLKISFLE